MARYDTVAMAADIPDGKAKVIQVGDEYVAIFHVNGTFYAMTDTCPHAGAPLSEGIVDAASLRVTCPWHGWTFTLDPDDDTPPADLICKYRVHVENGELKLEAVSP